MTAADGNREPREQFRRIKCGENASCRVRLDGEQHADLTRFKAQRHLEMIANAKVAGPHPDRRRARARIEEKLCNNAAIVCCNVIIVRSACCAHDFPSQLPPSLLAL